jgi:ubiquinone/menaquinone biosynthesis C-methylase UbiE
MRQVEIFRASEAKEWLRRNKSKLPPTHDPVSTAIAKANIKPKMVLEVGCANGWRLKELSKRFGCDCYGIDPAGGDAKHTYRGAADNLDMFSSRSFDMVIYGFCLYLCDPEDYFKIAAEGDRVLADDGHIVIYDFHSVYPHAVPYKHKKGVFSHKMDFSRLWTGHPAYSNIYIGRGGEDETVVHILSKNMKDSFRGKR